MTDQEINEKIYIGIFGAKWYMTPPENAKGVIGYVFTRRLFLDDMARLLQNAKMAVPATGDEPKAGLEDIPNYCNSIADAFKVVEKLIEKGFSWTVTRLFIKSESSVIFFKNPKIDKIFEGRDKCFAKAICLAALKTLENKLKNI